MINTSNKHLWSITVKYLDKPKKKNTSSFLGKQAPVAGFKGPLIPQWEWNMEIQKTKKKESKKKERKEKKTLLEKKNY